MQVSNFSRVGGRGVYLILGLLLEPGPLYSRVIQLGVGVTHLVILVRRREGGGGSTTSWPPTKSSNLSASPGSSLWGLARGDMREGWCSSRLGWGCHS